MCVCVCFFFFFFFLFFCSFLLFFFGGKGMGVGGISGDIASTYLVLHGLYLAYKSLQMTTQNIYSFIHEYSIF